MKNFLQCLKCGTRIDLVGLRKKDRVMQVKLGCAKCKELESFEIPEADFICWVKDPEISAALKVFRAPTAATEKKTAGLWE